MASNFNPKIFAATVMRNLHDNLIGMKICTKEHTGEITKAGDAVYFNGFASPTVGSYTGADISYEALQDSRVTLLVDQSDYFAFKVGDIEKVQAELDIKGSQAQEAAYGLQKAADTYVMGLYAQAGNTVTAATVTTSNVLSILGTFKKKLAENNVPENNMWVVIPPWFQLKLELAGIAFSINEGINGKGGMAWANTLGFDIFVTNQVNNNGSAFNIIAGSYNSIAFADQLTDTEDIRLEKTFDTAVRGLHVYGAKVIKQKELVTGAMTEGAETTI